MSGDHAKKEIMTGEKPAGSGRTLSRESDNKYKEEMGILFLHEVT
jgi:hypothetical protein